MASISLSTMIAELTPAKAYLFKSCPLPHPKSNITVCYFTIFSIANLFIMFIYFVI